MFADPVYPLQSDHNPNHMWARLHDGDRAYKLLNEQIKGNYYSNLFGFHPPFQIDGNFGYASGVCEMLLQSHMGQIHLLPALPSAWATGSVNGLKARGGFEVDMQWKDGAFSKGVVRSQQGKRCRLRSATALSVSRDGKSIATKSLEDGLIEFDTEPGAAYHIEQQD